MASVAPTDSAAARHAANARAWLRDFVRTPYAFILGAYVVMRYEAIFAVAARGYNDTKSYLAVSREPFWSPDFFAGERSPVLPLLFKLLPDEDRWRVLGQATLSIACWTGLAAAVALTVRNRRLRPWAFGAVLLFSASVQIIQWDAILISESISISLTAAALAAWLWLIGQPARRGALVAVTVTTLLWMFTRDSNAYLALLAVPVVVVWAWKAPAARRSLLVLAGLLTVFFGASVLAASTDAGKLRRADRPILHVVGSRILKNPNAIKYFRGQGMPKPTPLAVKQRRRLAAIGLTVKSDPETDRFLQWVRAEGRSALIRWLVTHPKGTVMAVINAREDIIGGVTQGYRSPEFRRIVPQPLDPVAYPNSFQSVFFWGLIAVVLAIWLALMAGGFTWLWLLPAWVLAVQIPHAALVYHADTLEIPRHAILVAVMTRLGVLLLALFVLDGLLRARRERPVSTNV